MNQKQFRSMTEKSRMRLQDLGEFGLIDRIQKWFASSLNKEIILGVGDDAAVLKYSKSKYLLLSSDTLVEDSHFRLKSTPASFLGAKALMVNLSDIFAMGGAPKFTLVNLALPKNISSTWVKEFYAGIKKTARRGKVFLVGGDTVLSPKRVMISVTVLGEVSKRDLLLRSGAKLGDFIAVSGSFGLAAAKNYKVLPPLRIKEAEFLTKRRLASAMIDSSDGLISSIEQICKASRVGAVVELAKVPVAGGANLKQALYGGEDYELVFTVPPSKLKKHGALKGFTVVGRVLGTKQGVRLVGLEGEIIVPERGFDHFKK